MTSDQEFDEFVRNNRDLIERMMRLEGGERKGPMDPYDSLLEFRSYADAGRARADDLFHAMYATAFDPEVQRHFMNMGMEFFLGMTAIMQRAPMPEMMREGFNATESSFRDAACRSNEGCGARRRPQKVEVEVKDEDPRRNIPIDVFKSPEE